MWNRILFMFAIVFASGVCAHSGCNAADPKPKEPTSDQLSLSNLSLEVVALQSLHRFQMTAEQMTALRKLAASTVSKPGGRTEGKGNDKHRQALLDLREALLKGKDERIEDLEDDLAELHEKEEANFDDQVNITAAARRKAPEALQSLRPAQIAAFFHVVADDLPDPLGMLLDALEVVGEYKDAEWKELTADIVDELSWQLGGLDPERSRLVGGNVEQYLKKIRSLNAKDLEKQRPELEKQARQFVAQAPPTAILHNFAEHTLAELLSNPRLPAALDARLDK